MSFADLLSDLAGPVIQAPMAGVQNHRLAAAVCEAGGLGSLAAAILTPDSLQTELQALSSATDRPYNVNFFCHTPPPPDAAREAAEVLLRDTPEVAKAHLARWLGSRNEYLKV